MTSQVDGILKQETLTGEGLPKFKENSWLKQWDSDQHTPESITFVIKGNKVTVVAGEKK